MNDQYNAKHESANLDLLRSVAVLCVFFGHLPEINYQMTNTTWHLGQMGVLIFFVHTSLVLMQSMERLGLEGRDLFGTFYLRRWFRIYPLSIFCVLLAYFLSAAPDIDHPIRHWNLKELFANLTLTQNLFYKDSMVGALWSLPLEVQMYVALPFLFLWFRNRSVKWLVALCVVSMPLGIVQGHITARLGVMGYVPCFLTGVLAWRIQHLYRPKLRSWLWPLAILAVTPIWFSSTREHDLYYRWVFCLAIGLIIPWFEDIDWKWISVPAKLVARYSYGIYLSHVAIMMFCFHGPLAGYSRFVQVSALIVLCVAVPVALYHLLEAPLITVGRNVTRRKSVRPRLPEAQNVLTTSA